MSKQVASVIPLCRAGSKREVADLTLYMASDAASFITGTTVVIDGGHWMTTPNSIEIMKTTLNSVLWSEIEILSIVIRSGVQSQLL